MALLPGEINSAFDVLIIPAVWEQEGPPKFVAEAVKEATGFTREAVLNPPGGGAHPATQTAPGSQAAAAAAAPPLDSKGGTGGSAPAAAQGHQPLAFPPAVPTWAPGGPSTGKGHDPMSGGNDAWSHYLAAQHAGGGATHGGPRSRPPP